MYCFCNVDWREKTHRAENPHPFRAVTIFGHQRRQATCSTRSDGHVDAMPLHPSSAFSPFHRAVTIFATVDKEYLIMIISHAKIPSTPHNHSRASAPAAPNKKGEYMIRPYDC
jgi:hypothetical protein